MYKIRKLSSQPAVYIIDGFLSADECQSLINVALKERLVPSKTGELGTKGKLNHKIRKSMQTKIDKNQNKIVAKIKQRINRIIKLPIRLQEKMQIARYNKKGFYTHHWDFGNTEIADRLVTFMIYLNDVKEGGETEFPNLGIRVIPKQGRALLWYNYRPLELPNQQQKSSKQVKIPMTLTADYNTYHAGVPLRKGVKWIANQWYSFKKKRGKVIKFGLTGK